MRSDQRTTAGGRQAPAYLIRQVHISIPNAVYQETGNKLYIQSEVRRLKVVAENNYFTAYEYLDGSPILLSNCRISYPDRRRPPLYDFITGLPNNPFRNKPEDPTTLNRCKMLYLNPTRASGLTDFVLISNFWAFGFDELERPGSRDPKDQRSKDYRVIIAILIQRRPKGMAERAGLMLLPQRFWDEAQLVDAEEEIVLV
jgi:hypothetical protein